MNIRRFTAEVAAVLAREHATDPRAELLVWLHMALRREASVGEIYGFANLERRLGRVTGPPAVVELLRTTIYSIWAQEKSHAAYLEAVLSAVAGAARPWRRLGARLDGFLGAMEGQVLSGRTSPSQLARARAALMLAVGRRVQDVPEFVSSLSVLSFRSFCLLNAELEITAVHGYERMLTLLGRIEGRDDTTLAVDVHKMVQDERFHNEAFLVMARWLGSPDGDRLRAGVAVGPCAERLAAIRTRVYAA